MTRRMGRLFWKFFVLITVFQLGADLLVRAWPIEKQRIEMIFRTQPPVPAASLSRLSIEDVMGDVVAGLSCAALLAWLLSKPIRSLHSAIADAANGNLNVRIADRMGPGNDELKDLGIEFDNMISRLRTLIVAQRQLLKDVSHEMRSPMARIQAAIGLAHQQPDQAPAVMERIERESVRIDKLIGELLALSRLQAGVDNSLSEEIELRDLLADIVDDARFEASANGREIHAESEVDGVLKGNVELLRRAIENVVRNAIKYSHRGGAVEVAAALGSSGHTAVISVRDSGTGVPEPDLAHIFDPFFRSSMHSRKDGSGLGLAIAKRVIDSHGGTIVASNVPGGGLQVNIELPLWQG
ncbi:MAG TPA: ATP-binding protein [Steroidobacteraceae bacterium]|nr:ATP-binding protein [Steroidobacteraceae bacterium]